MTTRRNHGGHVHRRRHMALHNLQERLKLGIKRVTVEHTVQQALKPKDIERMEAEIDVLKQRGVS